MNPFSKYATGVVVLLSSLFTACSESDDTPKTNGKVDFTVDGKTFESTDVDALIINGYLFFDARDKSGKEILHLDHRAGIAVYNYSVHTSDTVSLVYMPNDGASNYGFFAESSFGKINITAIDETTQTVTGTFEGNIARYDDREDEAEIAGSFSVHYEFQMLSTVEPTDLFKIDDVLVKGRTSMISNSENGYVYSGGGNEKGIDVQVPYDNGTFQIGEGATARCWMGVHSYRATSGTVTAARQDINNSEFHSGTYEFEMESYPVGGKFITITDGKYDFKLDK